MILCASDVFLQAVANMFTAILTQKGPPPQAWKEALIKVIFKKGDARLPENYRPICVIPLLYKLFSKVLLGRISIILERAQCVEQAGFRAGFSVDDHLFTVVAVIDRLAEFNLPLWVAAVDFCKAFDSVEFESIWKSLISHRVPTAYVRVLRSIYKHQIAKVVADKESKPIPIHRGTKQGDPISPALFNAVLQEVFVKIQRAWEKRGWGIECGGKQLTNLRFADDVLLLASSRRQLKGMIADLISGATHVGLQLHMGKTKVLTNCVHADRTPIAIQGKHVEVLSMGQGTKYLGRLLCLESSHHDREIDHRIAGAWRKFSHWKNELCSKHYSLQDRLKLFHAVVTPTILFGSKAWVMTADREHKLRNTQRRMLRCIVKVGRRSVKYQSEAGQEETLQIGRNSEDSSDESDANTANTNTSSSEAELEDYVTWIRRATHIAENATAKAGIEDWVVLQRRWKWRWAGHVARRPDNRWSNL
eukprot:5043515-Karenia_brevis.AAC.1